MATKDRFQESYDSTPPWDIGRPQRDLIAAFDAITPAPAATLDLGCGTGEHVFEWARRGAESWGIDGAASAISQARERAAQRGLTPTFRHGDALDLARLGRSFDLVIDCGLFHVLDEQEREIYVRQLELVLPAGGKSVMLGFGRDPNRDYGPSGYDPDELRNYFSGWDEHYVRSAGYEVVGGRAARDGATPVPDIPEVPAWISLFSRPMPA